MIKKKKHLNRFPLESSNTNTSARCLLERRSVTELTLLLFTHTSSSLVKSLCNKTQACLIWVPERTFLTCYIPPVSSHPDHLLGQYFSTFLSTLNYFLKLGDPAVSTSQVLALNSEIRLSLLPKYWP